MSRWLTVSLAALAVTLLSPPALARTEARLAWGNSLSEGGTDNVNSSAVHRSVDFGVQHALPMAQPAAMEAGKEYYSGCAHRLWFSSAPCLAVPVLPATGAA